MPLQSPRSAPQPSRRTKAAVKANGRPVGLNPAEISLNEPESTIRPLCETPGVAGRTGVLRGSALSPCKRSIGVRLPSPALEISMQTGYFYISGWDRCPPEARPERHCRHAARVRRARHRDSRSSSNLLNAGLSTDSARGGSRIATAPLWPPTRSPRSRSRRTSRRPTSSNLKTSSSAAARRPSQVVSWRSTTWLSRGGRERRSTRPGTAATRSSSASATVRSSPAGTRSGVVRRPSFRSRHTIPLIVAYGKRGACSVIGHDETLVFVVDLIAVN